MSTQMRLNTTDFATLEMPKAIHCRAGFDGVYSGEGEAFFIDEARLNKRNHNVGTVFLVGAGPGDPDLLTIKALRCIENADLIVYDRLVSKDILALIPKGKEKYYVGKAKGHHCVPQDKTNQFLLSAALCGKSVCRLKGGDGFIFGRGGEEMQVLHAQNVPVEVVPGITAASGCTSYAGIPLTHRGVSQGCTLVSAHAQKELSINWRALVELDHTLVFYMGLSKLDLICRELQEAGMAFSTPIAIIEKGCTADQQVFTSEIGKMQEAMKGRRFTSPSLIVVGQVVSLAAQLAWFNPGMHRAINTEKLSA